LQKNYLGSKTNNVKLQAEVAGWKARCADVEKHLGQEEVKVKELREEVSRGRKAIDGVRVAASVSCRNRINLVKLMYSMKERKLKQGWIRLKRN